MANSINTNSGAMTALRSLDRSTEALQVNQKRLSTGFKVADTRDEGAAFAVAQSIRSNVGTYSSVNSGISQAKGAIAVAGTAVSGINETLVKVREALTKLTDTTLSEGTRNSVQKEYTELRNAIVTQANEASYNGFNALGDQKQNVVTNPSGSIYAVGGLNVKGSVEGLSAEVTTAEQAKAMLASDGAFTSAQGKVSEAINTLEMDARRLDGQMKFNTAIEDSQKAGLGALVDADLAQESANLQSLQTRQQLSTQSLSIANQAPQALLSLFR